jgi:hypothetical protein
LDFWSLSSDEAEEGEGEGEGVAEGAAASAARDPTPPATRLRDKTLRTILFIFAFFVEGGDYQRWPAIFNPHF